MAQLLRLDRDGALRLIAIQSPLGQQLLADVPQRQRLESAHLVDREGRLFSGGAAAAPIAAELPALSATAPLLRRLSAPVDSTYRWIAANRERVGRLVSASRRERADAAIAEHQERFAGTG
uniref:Unannotated protein n=1 Tax=freshwater metagenome TaxID=449393 RepID=A0A6J6A210_9ZZZZ